MDRGLVLHMGFHLSMANLSHECDCSLMYIDFRVIEVGLLID